MVYLKQIFNGRIAAAFVLCLALLFVFVQVESSKIAYKKPIHGVLKANATKAKHLKAKISEELKSTTTKPTTVEPLAPLPLPITTSTWNSKEATNIATTKHDELEVAETTHAIKTELHTEENKPAELNENDDEQQQQIETATETTNKPNSNVTAEAITNNSMEFREVEDNQVEQQQLGEKTKNVPLDLAEAQEHAVVEEPLNFTEETTAETLATTITDVTGTNLESATTSLTTFVAGASTTTPAIITTTTMTAATTASKRPAPCTCGVFMTSQIKRTGNPYEPPMGRPVIINELDRMYPCNAVGQKQCQTKCLEAIVQHLPNSANILCASLDHDIRKERAYLFIKNCRHQWFNTNLAAGREYCCKNGQPYQCPMV